MKYLSFEINFNSRKTIIKTTLLLKQWISNNKMYYKPTTKNLNTLKPVFMGSQNNLRIHQFYKR